MKKRSFTLIEVITSLGLFAVLATFCIGWYFSLAQFEAKIETKRAQLLSHFNTYQELDTFFSLVQDQKERAPLFYTSYDDLNQKNLIFHVDLGVQPIAEFSGKVVGGLYYESKERCLKFTVWSTPDQLSASTQSCSLVLLQDVDSVQFSFFYPKDYSKPIHPSNIGDTEPYEGWQSDWKQSYQKLPAQVKLSIIQRAGPIVMQFDLSKPITFGELI